MFVIEANRGTVPTVKRYWTDRLSKLRDCGKRSATVPKTVPHRGRHSPKPLLHSQLGMEPMAGIEPATDGLRNRCSTAELHWHPRSRGPEKWRLGDDLTISREWR